MRFLTCEYYLLFVFEVRPLSASILQTRSNRQVLFVLDFCRMRSTFLANCVCVFYTRIKLPSPFKVHGTTATITLTMITNLSIFNNKRDEKCAVFSVYIW